jgi:hypothetical protein
MMRSEHHPVDDDDGKLGVQIHKYVRRIDRPANQRRYDESALIDTQ